ncbi:MAG: aminotransferase class V-fold PLP-dependent enzyme, partial [Acetobacteraceae bacterium]
MSFDVGRIRQDFPILGSMVRGKPLVFLDSGASAQKPRAVVQAMVRSMEERYANVHRGAYQLSEAATADYEAARVAVAGFLNAADPREVIFTSNSTAAINLVAHSWGRGVMQPGQAVLISELEHHANIIPWQMLRDDGRGIELRVCRVTNTGELDMDDLAAKLADGKVGLVAIAHMSNVLGTVTPVERIVAMAHAAGAKVLFDGSQAVVHRKVDMQALGADFYVFTGHKLYGPTGIGVLWARLEHQDRMPPFLGG